MNQTSIDDYARRIWDYMQMHHTLVPAEVMLVLGSNDLRVAERAAELYLQGFAPLVVFSGNVGALTRGVFPKPEAALFAEVASQRGVPTTAILRETASTNTGENITLSRALLKRHGIDPQHILLVQKPYMERRAFATFRRLWPEVAVQVTSPQLSYDDYPSETISRELLINVMIGDLQRIRVYPDAGFQIPQEIPATVWHAFEQLVALGYNERLLSPSSGSTAQAD